MLIAEKFEQILLDFLKVHHPRKIKKVPQIVEEFKGNEVELLKALCLKYGKDFNAIPELKDVLDAERPPAIEENIEVEADEPVAQLEVSTEELVEEVATVENEEEESDELDDAEDTVVENKEKKDA
jgi:hypothetical protein